MAKKQELSALTEIKQTLGNMSDQFKAALPPHISVDRFIRVARTAVSMDTSLLECNRQSLYGACMRAAQDGLLPDGNESAIVKFKTTAVYMPMVAGILKKVRNSGELSSITAQLVYENDEFQYWVDEEGEHLKHTPAIFGDRGHPKGVYALARTKDGAVYVEPMTMEQVEKVRKASRSGDSGPWKSWWEEMAKKTAIRRLSKRLPMSTDLEVVVRADDDLYDLDSRESKSKPEGPTRLKSVVDAARPVSVQTVTVTGDAEFEPGEPEAEEEPPPEEDDFEEPPL